MVQDVLYLPMAMSRVPTFSIDHCDSLYLVTSAMIMLPTVARKVKYAIAIYKICGDI